MTPLEALEKLTNYKCSCMSEKIKCKEIIKAVLKAFEIIKNKKVNIELIRQKEDITLEFGLTIQSIMIT